MNNFNLLVRYPQEADFVALDIDDEFNISLNYQIDDILDISKRNTSYSKTVTLPGTQKNNLFFKSVFDVNVNNISFIPTKRVAVIVTVTDTEVFRGDLQLINIKLNNKDISYEVVLTGKLRDILTQMSDVSIKELDLSEYDHIRNAQNIIDSWNYKVYINNNLVDVGEPGTGYVYPYIVRDVQQNIPIFETLDYNYYPAVYVKTIMDKIFQFNGYTYTSNFFESQYFKSLIIPFVEDKFTIDEGEYNDKMVFVGFDPSLGEAPDNPTNTGFVSLAGIFSRNSLWYDNSNFNYFFPLNRTSGGDSTLVQEAPFQFQNPNNQWFEFNGWNCTEAGYYDVSLKVRAFPKWFINVGCEFQYTGEGNFYWQYQIRVQSSTGLGGPTTLYNSGVLPFSPSDDVLHTTPWYDLDTPLFMNADVNNVYLNTGDRVFIVFRAVYPITDQDGNNTDWDGGPGCGFISAGDVKMRIVGSPFYDSTSGELSRLKIKKSTAQSYGQETGFMNQVLPNLKMKDFFLDIVRMFNLAIVDDPILPNNLLIEPRDDYYNSKQTVLDWNHKLDYDSEIKITPMSELDAKTYMFKYTDDNDWLNKEYTEETKKSFGELEIDVVNDFSVKTNKLELKFSPTPNGSHSYQSFYANYIAPYFVDFDNVVYKPKKVKPRILFYGGLINLSEINNNDLLFNLLDTSTTPPTPNTFNKFPYCGMWDHPTSPQWDLGFGRPEKIYWETQQFPTQTLYEKFHKATINNIVDINSKLLEGYFHLTPKDISLLDFRDIIFLNGQYWRINKVKDYNPIGRDELTKVELYLISDVKTYDKERISITTSNDSCPLDVVARQIKKEWFYVSSSGQIISEFCCKQLNGVFVNGMCKVNRRPVLPIFTPAPVSPAPGPIKPTPISDTIRPVRFKSGGPFITPISDKLGPVSNQSNNNSVGSPSIIQGFNNYITPNAGSNIIVGNNNTIGPDGRNVIILGNNIYANESGLYFTNGYFNEFGEFIKTEYYLIDGGEDEVLFVMKENLIDVVDGTENAIRNFGGDSKERPVIDGNITNGTEDVPPELS
jgi:hypothetical protein